MSEKDENFFDPAKFTDEEIDEKISKLMNRVNYVRYGMHNTYLAEQIEQMIDNLYFEKDSRAQKAAFKMTNSPVVFESEPDLRVKDMTPMEQDKSKFKRAGKVDNPFGNGPMIIKKKPKGL